MLLLTQPQISLAAARRWNMMQELPMRKPRSRACAFRQPTVNAHNSLRAAPQLSR